MRASGIINLAVFVFLAILAGVRPLPRRRRWKAISIGVLGAVLVFAAQGIGRGLPPLPASVVRDWLPSPLLLMVYWQAGQFFIQPNERFQQWLLRSDRKLADPVVAWLRGGRLRAWMAGYLEIAYLLCYPMVPLGLAALYLLHRGSYADRFWMAVLPPTYLCYVMVPFAPALPPRALGTPGGTARASSIRSLNLGILQHASIHANTFPSAHVAASMATALVLLTASPWVGAMFLWVAVSIAFGAVLGRYHYAMDAILGAAVAVAVFLGETVLR